MKRKMQTIPIGLIDPNPYRIFELHPIDSDRVDDLADSYTEHGDWGGITVRPHPTQKGRYQAAFGGHRINAAKKAGIKELHVTIDVWSDASMRKMLHDENATQQGMNAACTLESVFVAALDVGIEELTNYQKSDSSSRVRNAILRGEGIGVLRLRKILSQRKLPPSEIDAAVNQLRESGHWIVLLQKLREEFDGKDAEIVAEIDEALSKPATEADAPTFDPSVSALFENTTQTEVFRKAVSSEIGRQLVPVDKQKELAKQVVAKVRDENAESQHHDKRRARRSHERMSAQAIGIATNIKMGEGKLFSDNLKKKEKDRLAALAQKQSFEAQVNASVEKLRNGIAWAYPAALEIKSLSQKGTPNITGYEETHKSLQAFFRMKDEILSWFSSRKDIDV